MNHRDGDRVIDTRSGITGSVHIPEVGPAVVRRDGMPAEHAELLVWADPFIRLFTGTNLPEPMDAPDPLSTISERDWQCWQHRVAGMARPDPRRARQYAQRHHN